MSQGEQFEEHPPSSLFLLLPRASQSGIRYIALTLSVFPSTVQAKPVGWRVETWTWRTERSLLQRAVLSTPWTKISQGECYGCLLWVRLFIQKKTWRWWRTVCRLLVSVGTSNMVALVPFYILVWQVCVSVTDADNQISIDCVDTFPHILYVAQSRNLMAVLSMLRTMYTLSEAGTGWVLQSV